MDFEIACTCGQNMLVESRYVGQDVQCPGCGGVLRVPPVPRAGEPVPVVWPQSETVAPSPPSPPVSPPPYDADGGYCPPMVRRVHPKAIAALVCGVMGITTCPLIMSIASLILASSAKLDIRIRPDLYRGTGLATAGQLLGLIGVFFIPLACVVNGCLGFLHAF